MLQCMRRKAGDCSRVATGISWSSLGGLKGVKPPEAFGERSRGWPLGHAGDEGPHLRDDGGVSGWISSGGPRVRFLTRCLFTTSIEPKAYLVMSSLPPESEQLFVLPRHKVDGGVLKQG